MSLLGWWEGAAQEADIGQTCVVAAACMGQGMETGGERVGKGARAAGEHGSL